MSYLLKILIGARVISELWIEPDGFVDPVDCRGVTIEASQVATSVVDGRGVHCDDEMDVF